MTVVVCFVVLVSVTVLVFVTVVVLVGGDVEVELVVLVSAASVAVAVGVAVAVAVVLLAAPVGVSWLATLEAACLASLVTLLTVLEPQAASAQASAAPATSAAASRVIGVRAMSTVSRGSGRSQGGAYPTLGCARIRGLAARRVRTPGVPNARKLPLGGFTLVITATDAARQTSAAKRLSFTIVKR